MNVFSTIANAAFDKTFKLGMPLHDLAAIDVRKTTFAQMRSGKGFRLYPNKVQARVGGLTRTERKAARSAAANDTVREYSANLNRARELGLIGIGYVSPKDVAQKLVAHSKPTEKPKAVRKPRAKKVDA